MPSDLYTFHRLRLNAQNPLNFASYKKYPNNRYLTGLPPC